MKRIALISDTHNYIDSKLYKYLEECDEIWHAGDIGTITVTEKLEQIKPVRAVFGNIDGQDIRKTYPKFLEFTCEEVNVLITHIGGSPGKYSHEVKQKIKNSPPALFICGHSHILKVMWDKENNFLFMNPGACGISGFHKAKTLLRFSIDGDKIKDLEVIELGLR